MNIFKQEDETLAAIGEFLANLSEPKMDQGGGRKNRD
jgi:hypothetical protein